MRLRRNHTDTLSAEERVAWAVVQETMYEARTRELEAQRPAWWRRVWRLAVKHRAQFVPVVVIAGLWLAALLIRAERLGVVAVLLLGGPALGAYYWWRASRRADTLQAMLRPTLALAYLVASAVA
jgi:hypothetical protein